MLNWSEFVEIARATFDFLVAEYGFQCVSEKSPFVVFSTGKLQISVFFDANRNGELDLGLERCVDVGKSRPFFRVEQFKNVRGHAFPEPKVAPFLRSREDALRELQSLAVQLRLHCGQVLEGDLSDFDLIERQAGKG